MSQVTVPGPGVPSILQRRCYMIRVESRRDRASDVAVTSCSRRQKLRHRPAPVHIDAGVLCTGAENASDASIASMPWHRCFHRCCPMQSKHRSRLRCNQGIARDRISMPQLHRCNRCVVFLSGAIEASVLTSVQSRHRF